MIQVSDYDEHCTAGGHDELKVSEFLINVEERTKLRSE